VRLTTPVSQPRWLLPSRATPWTRPGTGPASSRRNLLRPFGVRWVPKGRPASREPSRSFWSMRLWARPWSTPTYWTGVDWGSIAPLIAYRVAEIGRRRWQRLLAG